MSEKKTFAEQILQFNEKLSHELFELPSGYKINNICPKIKVANKVITEYNIAILLLLHIVHPPLLHPQIEPN